MRILMAAPHPEAHGPVLKHSLLLVEALRGLGCEVTVVSWGRHSEHEGPLEKFTGRFRDILRLKRMLSAGGFDIFVIKSAHDWPALFRDVPLLLASRGKRPPTVLQMHGSQPERLIRPGSRVFKLLSARWVRNCDAAMVLSSEERRMWESFHPGGNFHVVSNPYVPKAASRPAAPAGPPPWPPLPPGMPVLLFVGRLMVDKGIFDLLKAVASIKDHVPFHLLVVGDGPAAEEFRATIGSLGLADRVTPAGYLQSDDLAVAYRAADVLVLPSYREGFPTVIAEAMDAGLPIVTTRIRGAVDHLIEGEHALFVPPRNPPELATALARILTDQPLRARMGAANRERVKRFLPERIGTEYLQVLKDVAGGRAHRVTTGPAGT